MTYEVKVDGVSYQVELEPHQDRWKCSVNGRPVLIDISAGGVETLSLLSEGNSYEIRVEDRLGDDSTTVVNGIPYSTAVSDPRAFRRRGPLAAGGEGPVQLLAPMPGKILRVLAKQNESVEAGQGLIVIEAMKMQNELKAPRKGIVRKIVDESTGSVSAGDLLAIIE